MQEQHDLHAQVHAVREQLRKSPGMDPAEGHDTDEFESASMSVRITMLDRAGCHSARTVFQRPETRY